jgi:hypothetical protein
MIKHCCTMFLLFVLPMACIWKHPKSKYWISRFLSADGEYKNRSTKETDSKKARKTAEDWEKVERMARRGVLVEAQAREVLNEILERTTGDQLQTHSCREWLEEWVKGKQVATAAKTGEVLAGCSRLS